MKNENLKYFIGRVCSIFTNQTNRNFSEENPKTALQQTHTYFVGIVEDIDDRGVLIKQIMTGMKSYFFMDSLVAISEEQVLNPENEKDAKVIEKMTADIEEKLKKYDRPDNELINPDDLTSLVKNLRPKTK